MRLRTVTLLAAIGQSLAVVCQIYYFARYVSGFTWSMIHERVITQPLYLFADITLVIFLFTLYARQKQ
jgi:hypothetical protein